MTGAQAVAAALRAADVEVAFGLPGVHNIGLWVAVREAGIRLVTVRHEQAAVYAADGYARATGRLGVALVTTGPGAANSLGATGEAWASGSPVLVLVTDVAAALKRPGVVRGSLHEGRDQVALFTPVTVSAQRVDSDPATALLAAARTALTARGPAMLELPTDLLAADAPPPENVEWTFDRAYRGELSTRCVGEAGEAVAASERPLLWAGGGAIDAGDEVRTLAEALGAPVITTFGASGLLGDHPLAVGAAPHAPEAGALWDQADLVIAIGSDLDAIDTQGWRQPQPPKLVAVNRDPADAAKNYRVDVTVEADAAAAARLAPADRREPWADVPAVRAAALAALPAEARAFLDAFAAAVPDDAVVLPDMCLPGYWLMGFHRRPAPRRMLTPLGWGTLGFAFPAALGPATAGHATVSVSGDGGFLFACGELATVAQEDLPLTAVVVDDGGYGMLRANPAYDERLRTPDYAALAAAFGIRSETVDGLGEEFGAALARHVAEPGPSLLLARSRVAAALADDLAALVSPRSRLTGCQRT